MANGLRMEIQLDSRALDFFRDRAPQKLAQAREKAVEAAGIVWADGAKRITRAENHIDTSLYVNSIGYVTGSPAKESDTIHDLQQERHKTTLKIGSNVAYAASLEKRYAIMARALDTSESRMKTVAETQVKNTLGL